MPDQPLPTAIRTWITDHDWGLHHLEWHTTRQWDTLSAAQQAWALQQGWQRADRQEGEAGNGFEFLLMHRAMLQLLRENFPEEAGLFVGWPDVPTNPDDANDPVPAGNPRPFTDAMLQAVQRIKTQAGSFADEDDFGRYVQTRRRPVDGNPFAVSPDNATGLHNYLHNRFSDSNSPIDMGDPSVNVENAQFWRLHGWIDVQWSAVRAAKGLSETDPAFVHALEQEKQHLLMGHGMPMLPTVAGRRRRAIPASLRRPFAEPLVQRFQRLMTTTPAITTLDELKDYLQTAIILEHSTLPPYLCALWSVKPSDQGGSASADDIIEILFDVAMQEMLHMGLACNLLKAIGGTPQINTPSAVPRWPDHLPGVQLPDLIDLRPLSRDRVKLFLKIEQPLHPIPPLLAALHVKYPTIGEFYAAIDAGLVAVNPTFSTAGQLTKDINGDELFVIDSLAKARQAVKLIQEQGEGTTLSQGAVDFGGGLAHYYLFQQIDLEKKYVQQPDGTYKLDPAAPLSFPAVAGIWPMAPVPDGGYPQQSAAFDAMYTQMLNQLQQAWDAGSAQSLSSAVTSMRKLKNLALTLMQTPRPDWQGNYGPDFRLVPPPPPGGTLAAALSATAAPRESPADKGR
jgi:hypothetical protein